MNDFAAASRIACVGAACIDHLLWVPGALIRDGEVSARSVRSYGGVAFNVATHLARLALDPVLVSLVGDDAAGTELIADAERRGIDARGVLRNGGAATAAYVAIFESGASYACADMSIYAHFSAAVLERAWHLVRGARIVFCDTNLPVDVFAEVARRRASAGFHYVIGASSVPTVANLPPRLDGVDLAFMNEAEAAAYLGGAARAAPEAASELVARGAKAAVVTRGRAGCVVAGPQLIAIPPVPAEVVDPTGAGDALIAGTLAEFARGTPLADAVRAGTVLAARAVETVGATAP